MIQNIYYTIWSCCCGQRSWLAESMQLTWSSCSSSCMNCSHACPLADEVQPNSERGQAQALHRVHTLVDKPLLLAMWQTRVRKDRMSRTCCWTTWRSAGFHNTSSCGAATLLLMWNGRLGPLLVTVVGGQVLCYCTEQLGHCLQVAVEHLLNALGQMACG